MLLSPQLAGISLENGAVGAKMTRTGRGGLVIALAENEDVQKKIASAIEGKGYNAWTATIG